jgi:hypothetical protein
MWDKLVLGSVTWPPLLFLEFLKLFVKMHLAISFRGVQILYFLDLHQKLWGFEDFRRSSGSQKIFYILIFLDWTSFYRFLTQFLIIPST